jgi:spore germination protein YaaH
MKNLIISLFLLLLIPHSFFAQQIQGKGSHQEHSEQFGSTIKLISQFDLNGKDIIPLQNKRVKALSKVVFGFLPYWQYDAGAHTNMHYDLLTHLAAFDFQASSTGAITYPSNWPWTDAINAAHFEGTKVIMVVTNFTATEIHTLLTNNTSKNNLFNNIKNTITNFQLDGVNIDFELINSSDRGSVLNNFMSDLTNYIHTNLPGKEVSFDSPAVNWSGWDFNGLAQSVDYLIIMGYDYNGSWSSSTGAVAPLTHPSGGICVTKTINDDYGVPLSNFPQKLILGVPYYGKHWKTSSNIAGAPVITYIGSTVYRDTVDEAISYGGNIWNTDSQTPYYTWEFGVWNQVWADNEQSLDLKYNLALNKNLGGIGIWALNYDGNRSELWDLIDTKFNSALAVDDSFIKKQINLYPNPTKTHLKVLNSNLIKLVIIDIFNVYGQKIKNCNVKNDIIDMANLKSAFYFIRIVDENGNQAVFKVIKS